MDDVDDKGGISSRSTLNRPQQPHPCREITLPLISRLSLTNAMVDPKILQAIMCTQL
jgi:hypothetical protein